MCSIDILLADDGPWRRPREQHVRRDVAGGGNAPASAGPVPAGPPAHVPRGEAVPPTEPTAVPDEARGPVRAEVGRCPRLRRASTPSHTARCRPTGRSPRAARWPAPRPRERSGGEPQVLEEFLSHWMEGQDAELEAGWTDQLTARDRARRGSTFVAVRFFPLDCQQRMARRGSVWCSWVRQHLLHGEGPRHGKGLLRGQG